MLYDMYDYLCTYAKEVYFVIQNPFQLCNAIYNKIKTLTKSHFVCFTLECDCYSLKVFPSIISMLKSSTLYNIFRSWVLLVMLAHEGAALMDGMSALQRDL